jgi:prepilin-type N-terminal cleavage/methylation domain-containing protein
MSTLRNTRRHGLSLLEVILAMAILGISMAAISQLFSLGYRSAYQASMRNEANMLADTKMAELTAGIIDAQSVGQTVIPEAPNWSYRVSIEDADQLGLLVATITLVQTEPTIPPVTMSVTRFVSDPDYERGDE